MNPETRTPIEKTEEKPASYETAGEKDMQPNMNTHKMNICKSRLQIPMETNTKSGKSQRARIALANQETWIGLW